MLFENPNDLSNTTHDVVWVSNSSRTALDISNFEKDTKATLKLVHDNDEKSTSSLKNIVANLVETSKPKVLILQCGDSAISNIDVKSASTENDQEWAELVEADEARCLM